MQCIIMQYIYHLLIVHKYALIYVQGFGVDNQYSFTSLRGGGSIPVGDKNQVLLILTSSGKCLNEVVSAVNKIAPTMLYR